MRRLESNSRNSGARSVPTLTLMEKDECSELSSARASIFRTRRSNVWVRCWKSHRFEDRFTSGRTVFARSKMEMNNSLKMGFGGDSLWTTLTAWRRNTLDRSARSRNSSRRPNCSGFSGRRASSKVSPVCSAICCRRFWRARSSSKTRSHNSMNLAYCPSILYSVAKRPWPSPSESAWVNGSSLNR